MLQNVTAIIEQVGFTLGWSYLKLSHGDSKVTMVTGYHKVTMPWLGYPKVTYSGPGNLQSPKDNRYLTCGCKLSTVSTAAAACRAAAELWGVQPAASVTKCTIPGQPSTAGHKVVQYQYPISTLHSVQYYHTI